MCPAVPMPTAVRRTSVWYVVSFVESVGETWRLCLFSESRLSQVKYLNNPPTKCVESVSGLLLVSDSSLGVITFILLSGNVPFDGETDQEVFAAVKNGYFDFTAPEWNNISKKAKGFVTQLLKKDPSARMTATQAMEHPWPQTLPYKRNSLAGVVKTGNGEGDVINMQDIYHQLETFACMSEFHRRALYVMVSELPEADIGHLRRVFQLIDEDGNGVILAEEIRRVLRQNGVACGRTGSGLMKRGTLGSDSISSGSSPRLSSSGTSSSGRKPFD